MGSFVSSVGSNRPSLHLFVSLSVCQSVTRPPFVSLFLRRPVNPFILPFIHPSVFPCLVCPSVRPPSFNSFVSLSVCPFVCQSIRFLTVCPSIHTFECPFLLPSMRLSICPSVHPVRRSDLSFWPSVRPSVCLSVFPNTYASVLSFVRPSNHLPIYNGS